MIKNKILGVTISVQSKNIVLEKIIKYINFPKGFFHIVSLNPENLVVANGDSGFEKVIETAQVKLIDGVGIVLAGRLLGMKLERYPGVELMDDLLNLGGKMRLRVLLIGGKPNLALDLSKCYKEKFPQAEFFGTMGIKNIDKPGKNEEEGILAIVRRHKPHLIFVSFGSPSQELWIDRHKKEFAGSVVMGVGGAFDFLSGKVNRAPALVKKLGLEWFFRLISQPWRWKRQLRLVRFIYLVLIERF